MNLQESTFRMFVVCAAVYLIIHGHPWLGFYCLLGAFCNYEQNTEEQQEHEES